MGRFLKTLSHEIFKFTVFGVLVVFAIWGINAYTDGELKFGHETLESRYEKDLTRKANKLIKALVQSDEFRIFSTVVFKDRLEKAVRTNRTPKFSQEHHTTSNEKKLNSNSLSSSFLPEEIQQALPKKDESLLTLPDMNHIPRKSESEQTKQTQEKIDALPKIAISEATNFVSSQNITYFNEEKIEIQYKDIRIQSISMLVLIDKSLLRSAALTPTALKTYLINTLLLNTERGDLVSIDTYTVKAPFDIIQWVKDVYADYISKPVKKVYDVVMDYSTLLIIILSLYLILVCLKWILDLFDIKLFKKQEDRKKSELVYRDESETKPNTGQHGPGSYGHPFSLDSDSSDEREDLLALMKEKPDVSTDILDTWLKEVSNER